MSNDLQSWPRSVWLFPAAVVAIGALPLPYGYYMFVRVVVCVTSGLLAWATYHGAARYRLWVILLGAIALLFNPIAPAHMGKQAWVVTDLAAAAMLVLHLVYVRGWKHRE